MLVEFKVSNFKNFNNNFTFDFSKVKNYEFNTECVKNNSVNKGLIYGPNGSGKSNLGFAILDIITHLTDNYRPDELYYNYLNGNNENNYAEFYYKFKFDKNIVEYTYKKLSLNELIFEELKINNKIIIHFNKTETSEFICNLKGTETLNKNMNNGKLSVIKYVMSNSNLKENKINKGFSDFIDFVQKMFFFRSLDFSVYIGYKTGKSDILKDIIKNNKLQDLQDFLNNSGIKCNLGIMKDLFNNDTIAAVFPNNKKIEFSQIVSTGTKSLVLFYYWLQKIKENLPSFIYIDEFDAFYHHKLSQMIITELKKIDCQIILTTHNTNLLNNDLLRPDCYFILNNEKIKPIYEFKNKELRYEHNIEKMYIAGAFNE